MIINNVVRAQGSEFLSIKARQQREYIKGIYDRYKHLEIAEIPMFPYEIKGLDRLREVEGVLFQSTGCADIARS